MSRAKVGWATFGTSLLLAILLFVVGWPVDSILYRFLGNEAKQLANGELCDGLLYAVRISCWLLSSYLVAVLSLHRYAVTATDTSIQEDAFAFTWWMSPGLLSPFALFRNTYGSSGLTLVYEAGKIILASWPLWVIGGLLSFLTGYLLASLAEWRSPWFWPIGSVIIILTVPVCFFLALLECARF
jgi:hypothetical protein